ncbi:hypothetical protein [Spirosoma litoris]
MDTQSQKLELIQWIAGLNDLRVLSQVSAIRQHDAGKSKLTKRHFGGGKHIIIHVDDNFNEPLDEFKDYMP